MDIINGSFILPSAGTWEVEYFGNIAINGGNVVGGLFIADTSNVEVPNSRSVTGSGASGGGNENAMVSNKVRITTSAPTTYKIRGIGNSASINLSSGLAISGVGNKVTWNKIAGQLPLNIVDNTASGYMDIGTMRMQWGITSDGGLDPATFTLPTAFANNTYTVTATAEDSSWSCSIENKTTTAFNLNRSSSATGIIEWNWIAIGLKS